MKISEPSPAYMPQLDGLRAIAVGAVIIHHFLPMERLIPYNFISFGDLGVRLFFVLSGFLITGILLRCRNDAQIDGVPQSLKLRQFYIRRFLRIFPVYYLTLATVAALNLPTVRETFFWHLSYLSNVYFSMRGSFGGPVSHFWSLAVEEQFYLLWPWFIVYAKRQHLPIIISITIIVAPLFRTLSYKLAGNELAGYILLFGCVDSLGLGALLAYHFWEKGGEHSRSMLRVSLWVGIAFFTLLGGLHWFNRGHLLSVVMMYLAVSLIFIWLIGRAACGFDGKLGKALELRPIVYVGRISYGIYLFHNFTPIIVPKLFELVGLPYPAGRGATIKQFLILVAVTLLLSALSWHFFEGPINRLKRYFKYNGSNINRAPASLGPVEISG